MSGGKNQDIPFAGNLTILSEAEETCYLYELIEMLTTQFEACMTAIASPGRENIMDDILQYIGHNYNKNLKLGTIAELFGYNSSYLGKVFINQLGRVLMLILMRCGFLIQNYCCLTRNIRFMRLRRWWGIRMWIIFIRNLRNM